MARAIFYLVLLITTSIHAQIDDKVEVKAAVDMFFEGFHKGDTTLMKSVMMDKVFIQTAYRDKEGKDILVTANLSN
jgi:hypothetical protein